MKAKYIIAILAAYSILTGCIRDDRSDCFCSVDLSFLYYGDGNSDIFPSKVDKVNLYVYSSENVLVEEHTYNKSALSERQGAHLELMPGDYHVVLWGNVFDNTAVRTDWATASVSEPAWSRADSYVGTDSLYFSSIDLNVPQSRAAVTGSCYFDCSHIDMKVRLTGFVGTIKEDGSCISSISLTHTGCPAWTDFYNVPSTGDLCDVTPPMILDPDDSDTFILNYNVLRFKESDPMDLVITDDSSDAVYTLDLAQFIAKYDIDVDNTQEAEVCVQITVSAIGVEVADWSVVEVTPGFESE